MQLQTDSDILRCQILERLTVGRSYKHLAASHIQSFWRRIHPPLHPPNLTAAKDALDEESPESLTAITQVPGATGVSHQSSDAVFTVCHFRHCQRPRLLKQNARTVVQKSFRSIRCGKAGSLLGKFQVKMQLPSRDMQRFT